MIDSSIFPPFAKGELRRARSETLLAKADQIEYGLDRIAKMAETLGRVLESAPDHAAWHECWVRYCRWQAILAPHLDRLVEWAHQFTTEQEIDPRAEALRSVYAWDEKFPSVVPDPVRNELAAEGLISPVGDRHVDKLLWQTALGRAVFSDLRCGR